MENIDSFLERFLNANQEIYNTIKNAPDETSAQIQLEMMAAFEKEDHCCSFCGKKIIEEKCNIVRGRWVVCLDNPECMPKSIQLIAFLKGDIVIQPDVTEFFKKRIAKGITDFFTVKEMFYIMGKLMDEFDPNK